MKRKICIATGTRADWGLLTPIAKGLAERDDIELQIIATNMHLMAEYGNTYREIERAGFAIDYKVPTKYTANDSAADTVAAMSEVMSGFATAFASLKPDQLIILGDRYEMLAVASAALIFQIPVVHIAGGAISEGAYDDSIRNAITKMSHIHLTETDEYRNRVIQMGEAPNRVFNTGAIGVDNILNIPVLPCDELEQFLGMSLDSDNTILVTFHPATLEKLTPSEQCGALLKVLDAHPELKIIFTYPNNDTNGRIIIDMLNEFVCRNADRAVIFPSLGVQRYLSTLHYIAAVVGNSSSGIVEVPSIGIPSLDIGIRQRGRMAADSVVHCAATVEGIEYGLRQVLSEQLHEIATRKDNPYQQSDTLAKMISAICDTPLDNITQKRFYDLPE
ncbi:MAG: UDP-N-acetylglucosamine 2-epimerase [Bacteroidales bacterium]